MRWGADMAMQKKTLITPTGMLEYELERKAVKRINLRVRRDGSVHVSAPSRVALETIEKFLVERAAWIDRAKGRQETLSDRYYEITLVEGEVLRIAGEDHVLHIAKGASTKSVREGGAVYLFAAHPEDPDSLARAFTRFVKDEAARVLGARLAEIAPRFAPKPPRTPALEINFNKSRWGVCTPAKGKIALNARLLFLPPSLADAVILHELCHFRVCNHSAAFYAELGKFLSDPRAVRRSFRAVRVPFWRGQEID